MVFTVMFAPSFPYSDDLRDPLNKSDLRLEADGKELLVNYFQGVNISAVNSASVFLQ